MSEFRVAAQGSRGAASWERARRASPRGRIPTGQVHAIRPSEGFTVCGLDVAEQCLVVFDEPWDLGFIDRCPRCIAAAPTD